MKTRKKPRTHVWVFEIKGQPGFYATSWGSAPVRRTSSVLSQALAVHTRKHGRKVKLQDEVLRKVSVSDVKIIPGR